jgi:hypothetical protein
MNTNTRYKVAQKGFPSNHLLNINAVFEGKKENGRDILSDVIYVEFAEGVKRNNVYSGYDTENKIAFKFNSYEIRVLKYELKKLISSGKSEYKKHHNPSLASSNDGVKEITLASNNTAFYINVEERENKKFGISFNSSELRAFMDCLELIAKETDEVLYKYQRALDKEIRKASY